MEHTTNLNLVKPDPEEFYNVQDFNDNMDKIDEASGNIQKMYIQDNKLMIESDDVTYSVPVTVV